MSLHKCLSCGNYTMKEKCPSCKDKAVPPAPPKFSIEHAKKYGKYRRELVRRMKEAEQKEKSKG